MRIFLAGVIILAGVVAGCSQPAAAPPASSTPPQAAPAVPTVTTVKPERKTVRRSIEQPGHIQAFEQTPIYVKIAGYVQKVHVDIGDRVRQGDLLAELWVPEMEQELKQKEALVAQAQAEIDQAQGALRAAGANLETAKALVHEAEAGRVRAQALYKRWESERKRLEVAVRNNALEQQVLDEAQYQFEAAEAARQEVEARVKSAEAARDASAAKRDKAEADVKAAKAKLRVAQADFLRMAALLQYAKVPAPFDGIVTRRHVDTGHFLLPTSGSGDKGEPLFVVVRTDPVRIFVEVPESDAVLVRTGAPARVRIQVLQGQELSGKVTRTAWSLDPKARTLRTEIDLPNPDGRLRPGMYAYARITVEQADVWTLPATALATQGEQTFCYRVENGKAIRTPLRVGVRDGQRMVVVQKQTKPAKPGEDGDWQDWTGAEEIVASSPGTLTDGQAVTVAQKP